MVTCRVEEECIRRITSFELMEGDCQVDPINYGKVWWQTPSKTYSFNKQVSRTKRVSIQALHEATSKTTQNADDKPKIMMMY